MSWFRTAVTGLGKAAWDKLFMWPDSATEQPESQPKHGRNPPLISFAGITLTFVKAVARFAVAKEFKTRCPYPSDNIGFNGYCRAQALKPAS